jgi:hypothetical protein
MHDRPAAAIDKRRCGSHVVDPPNHCSRSHRHSILARQCAATNRLRRRCSAYLRVEEDSATRRRFAEHVNPPASAREHQDQRKDMSRGLVSRRTAATGSSWSISARTYTARKYSPNSANPPCVVSDSSVAASLNGKTVCADRIAPTR